MKEYTLLFSDHDRPGIIAAISSIIFESGGNINRSEQYTSPEDMFFLRFEYSGENVAEKIRASFPKSSFSIREKRKKKIAIFASSERHCLSDLLWRIEEGEIMVEVEAIISNKKDAQIDANTHNIDFYHVPNQKDRREEERAILEVLDSDLDFVVLARYMRILSGEFLKEAQVPFINIHHSFLPAFPGIDPYDQAYQRGVKIIGATAHYVVEELDAGPIIDQRTARINHAHSIEDMKRIGREQERLVLAEAVRWESEDKIWLDQNRTVIFS